MRRARRVRQISRGIELLWRVSAEAAPHAHRRCAAGASSGLLYCMAAVLRRGVAMRPVRSRAGGHNAAVQCCFSRPRGGHAAASGTRRGQAAERQGARPAHHRHGTQYRTAGAAAQSCLRAATWPCARRAVDTLRTLAWAHTGALQRRACAAMRCWRLTRRGGVGRIEALSLPRATQEMPDRAGPAPLCAARLRRPRGAPGALQELCRLPRRGLLLPRAPGGGLAGPQEGVQGGAQGCSGGRG